MSLILCRAFSPNWNPRNEAVPLNMIVLHYTGMPETKAALARLCTKGTDVSAHYLIDEDGTAFQLIDEDKRAWHAGRGFWQGVRDINSASIGIELANPGHAFGYRAFPKPQIDALLTLLSEIIERHPTLDRRALWGHADVAPLRKEDPGELFPWQSLAAAGFGVWPPDTPQQAPSDVDSGLLLRAIGYEGLPDPAARHADLLAFQRHFLQDNLTGTDDARTRARLAAVAQSLQPLSRTPQRAKIIK